MQCLPKKLNQPNVPNTKCKIIDFNMYIKNNIIEYNI